MGKQIQFNSAQYNSSVLREHGFLPPQELKERFGYQVEALLSTVFYGEDYEAEDLMYLISTQRDTDTHEIEGRFLYNMEYMPEWYIEVDLRNDRVYLEIAVDDNSTTIEEIIDLVDILNTLFKENIFRIVEL